LTTEVNFHGVVTVPAMAARSGTLLGVGAAVSYGITIVCNRELATRGFGPAASLSVRFGVAGAALLAVLVVSRRPFLPAPGERWRALALGMLGYAVESVLFYSALQRGSAAAVALLFYSYPAMVAGLELATRQVQPNRRLLAALPLSVVGTLMIVTAGSIAISPGGVFFALLSAASFTGYLIVSSRVVPRTDALTNGAWVAIGASIAITGFGLAGGGGGFRAPGSSWWVMVLNGLATGAAFTLLFGALKRLGASRTAIVMTMEALSAVVLSALVLGERIGAREAVGGAAILAATVLVSSSRRTEPAVA
jgi:drug/metabolite transporter (DMT)-like permease